MERRSFASWLPPQLLGKFHSEMSEYFEKSTNASSITTAFAPKKHVKRAIKVNSFFIIENFKLIIK